MINPLLQNRRYILFYIYAWLEISAVHIVVSIYLNFPTYYVIADVLLHNLIFAIMGILIWFPVYFSNTRKKNTISIFLNHFASMVVMLLFWTYFTKYILSLIIHDVDYQGFTELTHVIRMAIGSLFYIIITLIYYLLIYYQSYKDKLVKEAELNTLVKETELRSLKSQINPHFLFNSLNSISSLTMSQATKAQEAIIKLSDFLRYSLGKTHEEKTKFIEEMENVQRYLDIEKVRFGENLEMLINHQDECEQASIPNMILQPLVENAIKHGVYENAEKTTITIDCLCYKNYLEVVIKNNYDPVAVPKKGAGVGLKNIANRLVLIYDRNDLLNIHHDDTEFCVTIRFPQSISLQENAKD